MRDEGFGAYARRVSRPYAAAVARHFDPAQASLTERGIDKLAARRADRVGGRSRRPFRSSSGPGSSARKRASGWPRLPRAGCRALRALATRARAGVREAGCWHSSGSCAAADGSDAVLEDRWSVGPARRRDRVPARMGRRARPAAPRGGRLARCAAARARRARCAGRGRRRRGRREAARPAATSRPGRAAGPGRDRAAPDRRGGDARDAPRRSGSPGPERRLERLRADLRTACSSTATSTSETCSCASAAVSVRSTRSPAPATAPTTRPTGSTPTGSRVAAPASRRWPQRPAATGGACATGAGSLPCTAEPTARAPCGSEPLGDRRRGHRRPRARCGAAPRCDRTGSPARLQSRHGPPRLLRRPLHALRRRPGARGVPARRAPVALRRRPASVHAARPARERPPPGGRGHGHRAGRRGRRELERDRARRRTRSTSTRRGSSCRTSPASPPSSTSPRCARRWPTSAATRRRSTR